MSSRIAAGIGFVCLATALVSCSGEQLAEEASGAPPAVHGSQEASGAMSDIEQRIHDVGVAHHPDHYAGVERVGDRVVVHRKPSATLEAGIRAAAGSVRIEFRDAEHSRAQLDSLRLRVERDLAWFRSRGVELTSVGVPEDGSAVVIGARDVELAERELVGRYGQAAPFTLERVGPVPF